MPRKSMSLLFETMILYRHSRALRRVAEEADLHLKAVKCNARKILPVAFLAREFGRQNAVSPASVIRAIKDKRLDAWNPTPCRYILSRRPRVKKESQLIKNS